MAAAGPKEAAGPPPPAAQELLLSTSGGGAAPLHQRILEESSHGAAGSCLATTLPPLLHPPSSCTAVSILSNICAPLPDRTPVGFSRKTAIPTFHTFWCSNDKPLPHSCSNPTKILCIGQTSFCNIYNIDFNHLYLNPNLLAFP